MCGRFTEDNFHCGEYCRLVLGGRQRLRLSKLLSLVLRHRPELIGVSLDENGFVDIELLVDGIKKYLSGDDWSWLSSMHIYAVANTCPKGRFEVRGGRIRATYGHSLRVKLDLPEDGSVKILYHGTLKLNVPRILMEGLKPMNRLYVHLTDNIDDALMVAKRRGKSLAILVIDADKLRRCGYRIYRAGKNVYLVSYVPVDCIVRVKHINLD